MKSRQATDTTPDLESTVETRPNAREDDRSGKTGSGPIKSEHTLTRIRRHPGTQQQWRGASHSYPLEEPTTGRDSTFASGRTRDNVRQLERDWSTTRERRHSRTEELGHHAGYLHQEDSQTRSKREPDESERVSVTDTRAANDTNLPDELKLKAEAVSGLSLDDVTVHYNSRKPATVQALAYTRGTDIHLRPGQKRHLPHELWHVVQQKQGRVDPTTYVGDVPLNTDPRLEREARTMSGKLTTTSIGDVSNETDPSCRARASAFQQSQPIQRVTGKESVTDYPIVEQVGPSCWLSVLEGLIHAKGSETSYLRTIVRSYPKNGDREVIGDHYDNNRRNQLNDVKERIDSLHSNLKGWRKKKDTKTIPLSELQKLAGKQNIELNHILPTQSNNDEIDIHTVLVNLRKSKNVAIRICNTLGSSKLIESYLEKTADEPPLESKDKNEWDNWFRKQEYPIQISVSAGTRPYPDKKLSNDFKKSIRSESRKKEGAKIDFSQYEERTFGSRHRHAMLVSGYDSSEKKVYIKNPNFENVTLIHPLSDIIKYNNIKNDNDEVKRITFHKITQLAQELSDDRVE